MFIYRSAIDFPDAWMNVLIILLAIGIFIYEPLDRLIDYKFFTTLHITSFGFGCYMIVGSVLNLTRVFWPEKPNIYLTSLMKAWTLSIFLLLFLSGIFSGMLNRDPVDSIVYLMCCLLALQNLFRTGE
jgi:hypothetical protein